MIRFESDYTEGMHPEILRHLVETNEEQSSGYCEDAHCERARYHIRQLCAMDSIDVHFMTGGTLANLTVISSVLRPHQGILSADSGHIFTHESGAIEATGHRVIALAGEQGKLTAAQIQSTVESHWQDPTHEHMVQPAMVYISQPTEHGTIYTKSELEAISHVCRTCGLTLYLDGARLGYALKAPGNDLDFSDLARLCDVFYIGGTKIGAMFGEAVVITKHELKRDFRYLIKQKGGLLAKGRMLGLQFETLLKDGPACLYLRIADHAVQAAMRIREAFMEIGCSFLNDSTTNQQFPILSNEQIAVLSARYSFYIWQKVDLEHAAVRFCTSWATRSEAVDELVRDIRSLRIAGSS